MNEAVEGVRLAKRVAAMQACSRSQAEALIVAGAVKVQGQVVTDPARRVAEGEPVQVNAGTAVGAMTVLLHKPAGMTAAQALREGWPSLGRGERPPPGLQELLPLPPQAAGLSVWSDERPVVRSVLDRERPLEMEWLLSLPLASAHTVLEPLEAAGLRICLGHDRDGVGHWRMVEKVDQARTWVDVLEQGPLRGGWALRRQRIGRLGLSPLASGEMRVRRDFEKF